MNKKIKTATIKKLLSGKYPQDRYALRTSYGYCCLGVMRTCLKDKTSSDVGRGYYLDSRQLDEAELTRVEERSLGSLNDDGVPFPIIAGFIQENL